jgi:hypothetical protein
MHIGMPASRTGTSPRLGKTLLTAGYQWRSSVIAHLRRQRVKGGGMTSAMGFSSLATCAAHTIQGDA